MKKYVVMWLNGREATLDADKIEINDSGDLCFYRQNITTYDLLCAFSKSAWLAVFREAKENANDK